MAPKRLHLILMLVVLATIIIPSLLPPARAAGVTFNVSQNSISIVMNLEIIDNLTTSLPSIDTVLDQSSPILQPIQQGFQSGVSTAHIDQLTLHVRTAEINNRTGTWIFQENYTMTVSGVTKNTGGRIIADLAFLSRNNQSITVSGVELNNIGQKYLVQGIQRFPPDTKTKYFAGAGGFTQPLIPEQYASSFSLLDLSWIPAVSTWPGSYQPFNSSTIWNLVPRAVPFNVTIGTNETPEQTFLKVYTASFDTSLEIIAPPRAQANGKTILFNIPTSAEVVMPIIVLVSLVTLITTFILERRVSKPVRVAKGRKR